MKPLIEPISVEILKRELNEKTFLCKTNKANNEIYVVNNETAPNVLLEIGRLREVCFRAEGAGTGKPYDLDHFDTDDKACFQLVVWNPEDNEIIGGYRFTRWKMASLHENGQPHVNTEHLFTFSQEFLKDYFPHCIEMARAFVQPKYQSSQGGRRSIYALDNLWDGIGCLIANDPSVKYLAGKVTIYSASPEASRKAMLYYLEKFYGDPKHLLVGKNPETFTKEERAELDKLFCGADAKENYRILKEFVKEQGDHIPPLIHSYIELSSSMRTFGTVFDPDFGNVYDTAMLITIADVYENKYERYVGCQKKKQQTQNPDYQPIIEPIAIELIKAELTPERFLRKTNHADNEIYIVNAHNAPNTMREIGRLREIAFRNAGGGTGKETDIDEYDTMDEPCQQLIVWNPDENEIIGGYRFILGENIRYNENGQPIIATAHLFNFSEKFIKNYMPNVLELGRSFVSLGYQSTKAGAKSLYALDNLWDGLGALTVKYPQIKYYFGKVTMYPSYNYKGRDMILYFLQKYFGDKKRLVTPIKPLKMITEKKALQELFTNVLLKDNYVVLKEKIKELGLNIPPLVNAYMNLSSTMKVFGTAINDEFGDVEETGILITVADIYEEKRERHIATYIDQLEDVIRAKVKIN